MNMIKIPLAYGGDLYTLPQNVRSFFTQKDGTIKLTLAGKGQFTTSLSEEELVQKLDIAVR